MPFPRREYSEETAEAIDRAVRGILERGFQCAEEILRAHRPLLVEAAQALLRQETLAGDELEALLGRVQQGPARDSHPAEPGFFNNETAGDPRPRELMKPKG